MFNLLDVVRINDSSSRFHKKKAKTVKFFMNDVEYVYDAEQHEFVKA